jgi:hypothetical protein
MQMQISKSMAAVVALLALAWVDPGSAAGPRRESVALTVYNQNFALVKDVRVLDLESGSQAVRIDDVAAFIDPTSVHFAALDHPGGVAVLEQNYQYDLADAERLLNRYLNQGCRRCSRMGDREGLSFPTTGSLVLGTGRASILNRGKCGTFFWGRCREGWW